VCDAVVEKTAYEVGFRLRFVAKKMTASVDVIAIRETSGEV
jgi:hypothetical protein